MVTPCTFLIPTKKYAENLRRYTTSMRSACPFSGYHNASINVGIGIFEKPPPSGDNHPHDDPRWPTACECGYQFTEKDSWQHQYNRLYAREDDPLILTTLRDAPVGAMWYADWMNDAHEIGPDGRALIVRLPGNNDWHVDGRASNCDSPCIHCGTPYRSHRHINDHSYQDAKPHKCWVRHGSPPNIHVDKNGITCGAGAGSISITGYHGFLHHGKLT